MPVKRSKARKADARSFAERTDRRASSHVVFGAVAGNGKLRNPLKNQAASKSAGNDYSCTIEKNQNGKYNIRIRASFGRGGWTLPVYFLASSFDGAMKKLEEALQVLQKNEERLRFWGVERSDDPNLAGDLLQEFGLWLDRRAEFPRKAADIGVPSERPVSASALAPVRRVLADVIAQERPTDRAAVALGE